MNIRLVIATAALISMAARAQYVPTLVQDPGSGTYTITYTDEAGTRRSVRFLGPDLAEPRAVVNIDAVAIGLRYSCAIGNGATARQPLFAIDVPCEESSRPPEPHPRMRLWNSGRAQLPGPLVFYCGWSLFTKAAMSGIVPGGQVGGALALQSAWLPGIRQGRATGFTHQVSFPGFRDETPEEIDTLFQSTEHPRVFPIVSPKYPPAAFENPAAGISIVVDELKQACSLGWVGKKRDDDDRRSEQDDELCSKLKQNLEQAQKHLARGKKKNAAHALQALLHELSEEKVDSNARALLFTDVNYLVTKVLREQDD
jgi:hypothetical protein